MYSPSLGFWLITPSLSKKTALFMGRATRCRSLVPRELRGGDCSLIQFLINPLRPRVIFRSAYINKHSVLLQSIHSLGEQFGKKVLLKAGWTLRNKLQNR